MSSNSEIEWTDATWNPVTGCTKVSAGCDNCYAERFAERWRNVKGHPYEQGFDLQKWPSRVDYPKRWRKPRMIFVNSMSDLFHKKIEREFIDEVFDTMEYANWHIYQVLTKRSSLMRQYLQDRYSHQPMPKHIWCGVTVESEAYTVRISHLRDTPAQIKFLSLEPLIAPIRQLNLDGIDWVILGGESGPNARPMNPEWVQQIRDECVKCDVPFFFKQWGGIRPKSGGRNFQGNEYNGMPKYQRRAKVNKFKWYPNEASPSIESHSEAKLKVLASYLAKYFDTLTSRRGVEEFKLDLVDGFCGGGTYQSESGEVLGSPLVMLEETLKAERRANLNRTKPIRFNVTFHFIDKEKAHTDHLRKVLSDRGFNSTKYQIEIHTTHFEKIAREIVKHINKRQPSSGRSLFLLDQTGYSAVCFQSIRHIFENLRNAEVIMTFAADSLLTYANPSDRFIKGLSAIEMDSQQLEKLLDSDPDKRLGLAQRELRNHFRSGTQALFDTPFFIRPKKSRKALWFIHLSRHAKARDVMVGRHWDVQNVFNHIGTGGFQMLGYDAFWEPHEIPIFNFADIDRNKMLAELQETIPQKLYELLKFSGSGALSVNTIHEMWANKTAARFSDIDDLLTLFVKESDFDLIRADGRNKNRKKIKTIHPTDLIVLPTTSQLEIFSRIKNEGNE